MKNSEFRIPNSKQGVITEGGLWIAFFLLILLLTTGARAQGEHPSKAVKAFQKATEAFQSNDWAGCEKELLKTIAADSAFTDAYIMLGDVFLETGKPELAVENYRYALRLDPDKPFILHNLLGNTLFDLERYAEACLHYAAIVEYPGSPANLKESANQKYRLCMARKSLVDSPVDFKPVNCGPGVNTPADEYVNALSAEGDQLFFTRRAETEEGQPKEFNENFFAASRFEGAWQTAEKLDYPPGTEDDAGGLCISPDGRLLFFTACFRADSYGSCDLYYAEKAGAVWSKARNMGATVNSDHWDAQPSIAPDGKTLYFASNRRGGYGNADLWKTERTPDGGWTKPVNLGPEVNTAQAEMAPFIHYDNATLYFSSGGHHGMGGMDLFKASRKGNSWSEPVNLGYPLNTSSDELIIIVSPDASTGYVSNNDILGEGGFDIFEFTMFPTIMPDPVTYLKGRVFDQATGNPLQAAFELIDLEQDSVIVRALSDPFNGEFLVCLPVNRNYALNVSGKGYLFYSDHFPLQQLKTSADPVVKDIYLVPVSIGNKLVLRNVFYETDQHELLPASFIELDILVDFLNNNPGLRVEIGGHTDDQGTEEYNLDLSDKRARNVYEYLMGEKIGANRISYKGYGESAPAAPNDTEAGRALNRRTEITVVGMD